MLRWFAWDEGQTLYETNSEEMADFTTDVPDELYRRWEEASTALGELETEIVGLHEAQNPYVPPPPGPPPDSPAAVTGSFPAPRTLAQYDHDQAVS